MAKPRPKKAPPQEPIEVDPEAFERFRSAVHKLAKAGPQHRESTKPKGDPNG